VSLSVVEREIKLLPDFSSHLGLQETQKQTSKTPFYNPDRCTGKVTKLHIIYGCIFNRFGVTAILLSMLGDDFTAPYIRYQLGLRQSKSNAVIPHLTAVAIAVEEAIFPGSFATPFSVWQKETERCEVSAL
jgi:hypothetical protein